MDLPKEFDVIVIGTGMTESIVAAALSRIGQSVLHIDRNDYYSGDWAAFNLKAVQPWAKEQKGETAYPLHHPDISVADLLKEGESSVEIPLEAKNFSNIDINFHVSEGEPEITTRSNVVYTCSASAVEEDTVEQITTAVKSMKIPSSASESSGPNDPDVNHSNNYDNVRSVDPSHSDGRDESEVTADNKLDTSNAQSKSTGCHTETNEAEIIEKESKSSEENVSKSECSDSQSSDQNDATRTPKIDSNRVDASTEESTVETTARSEEMAVEIPSNIDTSVQLEDSSNTDTSVQLEDSSNSGASEKKWTVMELTKEWRRFNLDLAPKVLYCRGAMVELLISSDIAKYCEFKTVTRILTERKGKLEKVPCSRSDVFSSKQVSVLEKRILMKYLNYCLEFDQHPEEYEEYKNRPFVDFLQFKRLPENVRQYVQYAIAMATEKTTTSEGLKATQKFLQSLGRYGNTSYLWPLYGSGELPQSFCRMSAVFGGIYMLRMSASSLIINKENRCCGIITTEGQRIDCKWIIMSSTYSPSQYIKPEDHRSISRAVFITDKSILIGESQELSMLYMPSSDAESSSISVLELPPSSMSCPVGTYVVHLTCEAKEYPKSDFQAVVQKLFSAESNTDEHDAEKPSILWSAYFTASRWTGQSLSDQLPGDIHLLPGPGSEVDIDYTVAQAKEIFERLCPDEEFLPKAPNAEDIIYDDGEQNSDSSNINTEQTEFDEHDTESVNVNVDNSTEKNTESVTIDSNEVGVIVEAESQDNNTEVEDSQNAELNESDNVTEAKNQL